MPSSNVLLSEILKLANTEKGQITFNTKSISADVASEAAASVATAAAAAAPTTSCCCCCCLVGGKGMVKGPQSMFARMLRLLLLLLLLLLFLRCMEQFVLYNTCSDNKDLC